MSEWHWCETDKSFIELVQWAVVFSMLAKEQKTGWIKNVFDKEQFMKIAADIGCTETAVAKEMISIGQSFQNADSKTHMTAAFEQVHEEYINDLINRSKYQDRNNN